MTLSPSSPQHKNLCSPYANLFFHPGKNNSTPYGSFPFFSLFPSTVSHNLFNPLLIGSLPLAQLKRTQGISSFPSTISNSISHSSSIEREGVEAISSFTPPSKTTFFPERVAHWKVVTFFTCLIKGFSNAIHGMKGLLRKEEQQVAYLRETGELRDIRGEELTSLRIEENVILKSHEDITLQREEQYMVYLREKESRGEERDTTGDELTSLGREENAILRSHEDIRAQREDQRMVYLREEENIGGVQDTEETRLAPLAREENPILRNHEDSGLQREEQHMVYLREVQDSRGEELTSLESEENVILRGYEDPGLMALEALRSFIQQHEPSREEVVSRFHLVPVDVQEAVKLAMWILAVQSSLPIVEEDIDWATHVIHHESFSREERGDLAVHSHLNAAQSLFQQAIDSVIHILRREKTEGIEEAVSEIEELKGCLGRDDLSREQVVDRFYTLPTAEQLKIKHAMWALAGQEMDPYHPQPYDRHDEEDWAGRVIGDLMTEQPDIVHHRNIIGSNSLFRRALHLVCLGKEVEDLLVQPS